MKRKAEEAKVLITKDGRELVPVDSLKPRKWEPGLVKQAYQLTLLGATDRQLADAFEVSVESIDLWKRVHPEFYEAIVKGKMIADAKVAESFYKIATGYEYEEDVFVSNKKGGGYTVRLKKYQPPLAWACFKWLECRQRGTWGSIGKGKDGAQYNTQININAVDLSDFSLDELKMMEKLGLKQNGMMP